MKVIREFKLLLSEEKYNLLIKALEFYRSSANYKENKESFDEIIDCFVKIKNR